MNTLLTGYLISRFLTDLQHSAAPATYGWYSNYLHCFRAHIGERPASKVTSSIVYAWLDKYYGQRSDATRHAAARTVTRLFNWAVGEQLLERSPLVKFRKPAASHREVAITGSQYAECVRASHGSLRDVVKFLWHTGCRPQELRCLEAAWLSNHKFVLPFSNSKGGKVRRVLWMDAFADGIATRLVKRQPIGPIFRTDRGQPWSKNSLALAFRRLRNQTGIPGLCAYAFRHSFVTRLLERGVDVATVATLAGNSPRMILDVYQHVARNDARLLATLQG